MKTILLIGAMKCGTSTLYDWIAQHPNICPCADKEPEFFSSIYTSPVPVEHYDELWRANPQQHEYRIEGSTGYTKFPAEAGVPARIKAHGIDPWFIYIVRNPLERIASHYNHNRRDPGFDPATRLSNDHFISTSRYYLQLEQYLHVFPDRSRYLVLDYAELASPAELCRKVYDFLGLDVTFTPTFVSQNVTTKRYRLDQIAQCCGPLRQLARWMPRGWKTRLRQAGGVLTKGAAAIPAAEVAYIQARLNDDMMRLQQAFGIDTSRWGFAAPTPAAPTRARPAISVAPA